MPRELPARSNDPGAAAQEILEQINYTGETVTVVFNGEINGRHVRNLSVDVQPATPVDDVVQAMREAAQEQR